MPVRLPDLNPKRELARKLVESLISQIPFVGGPYVAMLSVTRRSDAEKKLADWRDDITASVNNLEALAAELIPTIKLSDGASSLAVWLSKNSQLGRAENVMFDSVRSAFLDATKLELEDACGELQLDGLLKTSGAIGHKILMVHPTNLLFEIFDPIVFDGANPRVDAAHLAGFILRRDGGSTSAQLVKEFGWTARRLNPAVSILCDMVSEGAKSGEIHREFECVYIRPSSAERARFRRYMASILGSEI